MMEARESILRFASRCVESSRHPSGHLATRKSTSYTTGIAAMKKICVSVFVLLALFPFSCAQLTDSPSSIYNAASTRHHQLAHGEVKVMDEEWISLIGEFQRVINADPHGKWADDAQYAITSCWMWLRENIGSRARDGTGAPEATPTQRAIDAFKTLIDKYPGSQYTAEANYWLGYCYQALGDESRALTYYQTVIRNYLAHPISEDAQLQLGEVYERQQYFSSAMATYQALAQRAKKAEIVAETEKRIANLQQKQVASSARAADTSEQRQAYQQKLPSVIGAVPQVQSGKDAPSTPTDSSFQKRPGQPSNAPGTSALDTGSASSRGVAQQSEQVGSANGTDRALFDTPSKPSAQKQSKLVGTAKGSKTQIDMPPIDRGRRFKKFIVIDPGHGGKDPGAVNRASGHEKKVVLDISKKLRDILVKKGYRVRLTRETDTYLSLTDRKKLATKQNANLFISIHANAFSSRRVSGIETYYSTKNRRLAQVIHKQLIRATKAKDRGVRNAPFRVLSGTKVPAILIEVGFMTNPKEAKKLVTKTYQRQIATGIAKGVEEYLANTSATVARAKAKASRKRKPGE